VESVFHTVAGFVLDRLGRIPHVSDHFVWEGLRFEVADMDGRRKDAVLITPVEGSGKNRAKEDDGAGR
jgi:putative hemolysin